MRSRTRRSPWRTLSSNWSERKPRSKRITRRRKPCMVAETHPASAGHEHSLLHHHFDDLAQQRECNSLGMWTFLVTEIMMFGGLFFAYSLYRWKFGAAFHVGSMYLDHKMGTINTFVLLASSWTMAMGVYNAGRKNRQMLVLFLTITWLFGAAFIIVKGFEWTKDYNEGLVPTL